MNKAKKKKEASIFQARGVGGINLPELLADYESVSSTMERCGVEIIEAEYEGSGDDGCIERITCLDVESKPMSLDKDMCSHKRRAVENIANSFIEMLGIDYSNNGGGSGTVRLHKDGRIEIIGEENYVAHDEYEHDFNAVIELAKLRLEGEGGGQ